MTETIGEDEDQRTASGRGPIVVVALVLVIGVVPLVVALVVLRRPQFFPSLDIALTELRVRDVASREPPLVGLGGRLDAFGQGGHHPGPLSFWLLWGVYALLGGSAWALQVSTVLLHLGAVAAATWIGLRRGGRVGALGVATVLAVLAGAYGPERLTEPWNPYLPVLWWVVFLLAVWSVLCDDRLLLPVAVLAGSLCAQTHISYLGLVLGIGLVTASVFLLRRPAFGRRAAVAGGCVMFLALLWLPPLIDQLANEPGNVGLLREHFAHPPEPAVGLGDIALTTWLTYLNPWTFVGRPASAMARQGSILPGLVVVAAWAASVLVSWRRRDEHPELIRLHLVVALALGLGLVSISRVLGQLWEYLILWSWGTTAVLVLAVGWTIGAVLADRPRRVAPAGMVATLVVASAVFTYDAGFTDVSGERESRALAALVPDTVAALRRRDDGDGLHLVRWTEDGQGTASAAFGLLNELDRTGIEVGVHGDGTQAVHRRDIDPRHAVAAVTLVGGAAIEAWDRTPGVERVAFHEPRTPEQLARHRELHDEIEAELRAAGREELIPLFELNPVSLGFSADTPEDVLPLLTRLLDLGLPLAVFVGPVEVVPGLALG